MVNPNDDINNQRFAEYDRQSNDLINKVGQNHYGMSDTTQGAEKLYNEAGYGQEANYINDQADLGYENAQMDAADAQRNALSQQTNAGLDESTFGDYKTSFTEAANAQNVEGAKVQKETAADRFERQHIMQMRDVFAKRQSQVIDQKFGEEMQKRARDFQKLQQSTEYKFSQDIAARKQQMQLDYEKAQRDISKNIAETNGTAGAVQGVGAAAGSALTLLGGILAPFTAGASLALSIGGAALSAGSSVASGAIKAGGARSNGNKNRNMLANSRFR